MTLPERSWVPAPSGLLTALTTVYRPDYSLRSIPGQEEWILNLQDVVAHADAYTNGTPGASGVVRILPVLAVGIAAPTVGSPETPGAPCLYLTPEGAFELTEGRTRSPLLVAAIGFDKNVIGNRANNAVSVLRAQVVEILTGLGAPITPSSA